MQPRTDDCISHPTNFIIQCFPSKCWWIKLLRGLRASSCQPVAVKMYNMMHNCSQSNFLHRNRDFHRSLYRDKQSLSQFVQLVSHLQCVSVLRNTKKWEMEKSCRAASCVYSSLHPFSVDEHCNVHSEHLCFLRSTLCTYSHLLAVELFSLSESCLQLFALVFAGAWEQQLDCANCKLHLFALACCRALFFIRELYSFTFVST